MLIICNTIGQKINCVNQLWVSPGHFPLRASFSRSPSNSFQGGGPGAHAGEIQSRCHCKVVTRPSPWARPVLHCVPAAGGAWGTTGNAHGAQKWLAVAAKARGGRPAPRAPRGPSLLPSLQGARSSLALRVTGHSRGSRRRPAPGPDMAAAPRDLRARRPGPAPRRARARRSLTTASASAAGGCRGWRG